jgi:hypothetical protein
MAKYITDMGTLQMMPTITKQYEVQCNVLAIGHETVLIVWIGSHCDDDDSLGQFSSHAVPCLFLIFELNGDIRVASFRVNTFRQPPPARPHCGLTPRQVRVLKGRRTPQTTTKPYD